MPTLISITKCEQFSLPAQIGVFLLLFFWPQEKPAESLLTVREGITSLAS